MWNKYNVKEVGIPILARRKALIKSVLANNLKLKG